MNGPVLNLWKQIFTITAFFFLNEERGYVLSSYKQNVYFFVQKTIELSLFILGWTRLFLEVMIPPIVPSGAQIAWKESFALLTP